MKLTFLHYCSLEGREGGTETKGGPVFLSLVRYFKIQQRVKKIIGRFNEQNNNFTRAHTFLYISLPFLHDYDLKMPNFAVYGERKQATTKFYFSF